ncbi:unnamed protein product, partial [marine sediment metagenome]
ARFMPLFAVSCIDVVLWIVFIASAFILMTGDSGISPVLSLVVACGASWVLSGFWFDRSHRLARWLFFLSPPLVLVLLAAATWWVLVAWGP